MCEHLNVENSELPLPAAGERSRLNRSGTYRMVSFSTKSATFTNTILNINLTPAYTRPTLWPHNVNRTQARGRYPPEIELLFILDSWSHVVIKDRIENIDVADFGCTRVLT